MAMGTTTDAATDLEYRIGEAVLQPQRRRLLVGGQDSRIGARAFDLLLVLIQNRERIVDKNELLDAVWPGLVVEENNLQVHISALRKLLGPQAIATVPGRGYRFTGALEGSLPLTTAPLAATDTAPNATQAPDAAAPHNLPADAAELFGRSDDLAVLLSMVDTHKLVTLVGAGGIGKTALAQAVAHAVAQRMRGVMPDGVWIVELAPLTQSSLVVASVAGVLGIRLNGEASVATLASALGSSRMLVVLDNCEGLLDGTAELAAALHRAAPNVRLLATSQEPLHLPHEQVYRLGPLAVPEAAAAAELARQAGAVALFAARARALQPQFVIGAHNVAAVVAICRHLDGIALAIELAAARVPLLGVEGLLARLGERFRMLTGGSRLALRRHQTLRAALDWSYGLLSASEQAAFRQLGVFSGGFSLQAVQALAGDAAALDPWAVLENLGALVDKSLVVADTAATPRYRLLETTRAYALEQLAEAGETEATVARHAQVVLELFERADEACFGEQGSWLIDDFVEQLWPEFDNLRAALAWAMAEPGQAPLAIALAGAAAEPFRLVGQSIDVLTPMLALQPLVDDSADPRWAARFWVGIAIIGSESNRVPVPQTLDAYSRAEKIYLRGPSPRRLFRTLYRKAWALCWSDRVPDAEAVLREMQQLEQPSWPGGLRFLHSDLQGHRFCRKGQYEQALAAMQAGSALLPASGHEFFRLSGIGNQCMVLIRLGRFDEGEAMARSVIERHAHDRHHSRFVALCFGERLCALNELGRLQDALLTLHEGTPLWRRQGMLLYMCIDAGQLFAKLGRPADAARLAGAKAAQEQRLGVVLDPFMKQQFNVLMQLLAAPGIASEDIERWMDEGSHLETEDLAALYLRDAAALSGRTD
jgi:predicted ATPase/DNA-binding winged helix-turn-helix (wHTH) protein